jgi:hypothetical protein
MRRYTTAGCFFLVSLLCTLLANCWATDIQVKAELRPEHFALDQQAAFIVTIEGSSAAQPELPSVQGLQFQPRGQSQQTSWVNGQVSASVSFNYVVQADKPGKYTIGPVQVTVAGRNYSSQPITCTVGPAQQSGARQSAPQFGGSKVPALSADESAKIGTLTIIPTKKQFYVGEIIPFTIKAYFEPRKRININTAPVLTGDNFLLHDLDKEPVQRQEKFMGRWGTSLTWQGAFSAVKEGPSSLSVQLDVDLLVPQQRQQQRHIDPFDMFNDPFFDNFFNSYQKKEVKLTSQKQDLTILPMPSKNRPADFTGAIGTFSLAVTASPTDGKVGEPITLKIKIDGKGNFDRVQTAVLQERKGWKTYPASANFTGQNGGKGEKTFEQAIIPTDTSLTEVPSLRFSYFDPNIGDYVSLNSEPIPLHLQANKDAVSSPAQSTAPGPLPKKTPRKRQEPAIPSLPLTPGEMVHSLQPLYQKRWFQGMMLGAGCCLTTGLLLDLRRKRLENNPGLLQRRFMERQLAKHCKNMKRALESGEQEVFQDHCRKAIQVWAGTTWGLEADAITLADLQVHLPADSPLLHIFTRLEQSGYAGENLDQTEMKTILKSIQDKLT